MIVGVTVRPCRLDECAVVLDLWKDVGSIPSISDSLERLRRLL